MNEFEGEDIENLSKVERMRFMLVYKKSSAEQSIIEDIASIRDNDMLSSILNSITQVSFADAKYNNLSHYYDMIKDGNLIYAKKPCDVAFAKGSLAFFKTNLEILGKEKFSELLDENQLSKYSEDLDKCVQDVPCNEALLNAKRDIWELIKNNVLKIEARPEEQEKNTGALAWMQNNPVKTIAGALIMVGAVAAVDCAVHKYMSK